MTIWIFLKPIFKFLLVKLHGLIISAASFSSNSLSFSLALSLAICFKELGL